MHFSGHASSWGVLLEDEAGTQDGTDLDYGLLARALGATDEQPRLVVLIAYESLDGADDLLQTVPAVIGMSDTITDLAAVTFAARFYAAVAHFLRSTRRDTPRGCAYCASSRGRVRITAPRRWMRCRPPWADASSMRPGARRKRSRGGPAPGTSSSPCCAKWACLSTWRTPSMTPPGMR